MSRVGSIPDPFGSLLPGRRALAKVIQALPDELRGRIADSGELLPAADACDRRFPRSGRRSTRRFAAPCLQRQRLRLWYREAMHGAGLNDELATFIAWRGLASQWALVGHSSADESIRLFWLPWIEAVRADRRTLLDPAAVSISSDF